MEKMQKIGLLVAAYLINNRGDIPEKKLMADLHDQLERYPGLRAITQPNPDGTIPDVIVILKQWVHAGIIGCKEETQCDTKFYLRDLNALMELLIG